MKRTTILNKINKMIKKYELKQVIPPLMSYYNSEPFNFISDVVYKYTQIKKNHLTSNLWIFFKIPPETKYLYGIMITREQMEDNVLKLGDIHNICIFIENLNAKRNTRTSNKSD